VPAPLRTRPVKPVVASSQIAAVDSGDVAVEAEELTNDWTVQVGAFSRFKAAHSSAKAALCRQLFVETDALLERGVAGSTIADERRAVLDTHRKLLEEGELAVVWDTRDDGTLECTVVAPDRRGLLAAVAGVLTLVGFDIQSASGFSDPDTNMALEVYRGVDQYGRLDDAGQRDFVTMLRSALSGALPLRERLSERVRRYRSPMGPGAEGVDVLIDLDASASSTVIEVHAPDQVGLLASVAAVFADLDVEGIDRVVRVNLLGVLYGTHAFLPGMRARAPVPAPLTTIHRPSCTADMVSGFNVTLDWTGGAGTGFQPCPSSIAFNRWGV